MKHSIIPFEIHRLPFDQVDPHALYVMEKLKQAGFVAYLVGGSVRDLLLNHVPKDFDISTSAKPEEIKKVFRNCLLIGKRFRLAHIRFGKKILEVSTFRAGDPEKEELILRDNKWGYPEEDALRRDFTINGLFYDPSNQTIIDYVEGFQDIKRRYLRTIGVSYARFKQDPVRMLRLLKFQARFNLEVDPEAHLALVECREEIMKSSPARVLEEMFRMLESGSANSFIKLLLHHGMLSYLLPEVSHFMEKEKEGVDIYSYLQEIDLIFQDPTLEKLERPVLLSALIFPLLHKQLVRQFLERNHTPHLGQIQQHTKTLISEMFEGFFLVPRKIRVSMHNILLSQYRLTPLQKKRGKRPRIPKDEDFPLALKFLNLRSCLEPGLTKIYEDWNNSYANFLKKPAKPNQA